MLENIIRDKIDIALRVNAMSIIFFSILRSFISLGVNGRLGSGFVETTAIGDSEALNASSFNFRCFKYELYKYTETRFNVMPMMSVRKRFRKTLVKLMRIPPNFVALKSERP